MTTAAPPRGKSKDKPATFERSAWRSWDTHEAPARQVTITLTEETVDQSYWSNYRDPVSMAIKPLLNDNSCVQTFWNSDSWAPMGSYDDARIGVHVETSGDREETSYWLPLPTRAALAMWKLRSQGLEGFKPVTMRLKLPVAALRD